eukprot:m.306891 g.306891  ORF g.306891 m.306891 type:complete len:210 (+) comp41678_c0_seq1:170-799(+)
MELLAALTAGLTSIILFLLLFQLMEQILQMRCGELLQDHTALPKLSPLSLFFWGQVFGTRKIEIADDDSKLNTDIEACQSRERQNNWSAWSARSVKRARSRCENKKTERVLFQQEGKQPVSTGFIKSRWKEEDSQVEVKCLLVDVQMAGLNALTDRGVPFVDELTDEDDGLHVLGGMIILADRSNLQLVGVNQNGRVHLTYSDGQMTAA